MAVTDSTKQKHCPKKRIARKDYSREVVSPSLLAQINARDPKKISKEVSLGMSGWTLMKKMARRTVCLAVTTTISSNHLMLGRLDSTVFVT